MLSTHATFEAAARKGGQETRIFCEIYVTGRADPYQFLDRPVAGQDYPCSLCALVPVTREIDWKERKCTGNTVVLRFTRSPLVEKMIYTNPIVGGSAQLWLGFVGVSIANYSELFRGIMEEPRVYDEHIEIPVQVAEGELLEREILGGWINVNPLTVYVDAISRAGLASWRDAASFLIANNDEIAHYCVSRATVYDPPKAAPAFSARTRANDVIKDLLFLTNSQLVTQEDGLIYHKRYNTSAAASVNWTENDIHDFEIVSLYENLCNSVSVSTHNRFDWNGGPSSWCLSVEVDDTDSQALFGTQDPGGGGFEPRVERYTLGSLWVNGYGRISAAMTDISPAAGGSFNVIHADAPALSVEWRTGVGQLEAMCGACWGSDYGGGAAQAADYQLDDDHTAFLQIGDEVIEVDRLTIAKLSDCAVRTEIPYSDPNDATPNADLVWPVSITYRVKSRGAKGTTAAAHSAYVSAYDATMQYAAAEARVAQLANGGPVIKFKTSLRWHKIQLMDLATVTKPDFLAFNFSGLGTNTKGFVIGKTEDPCGDDPSITWTLLYATQTVPPASTIVPSRRPEISGRFIVDQYLRQAGASSTEFANNYVVNGMQVSATGGFGISIAAGVVTSGNLRCELGWSRAHTCRASKDTYVYWSLAKDNPVYYDVPNMDPAPPAQGSWVPLAKAVTDGAGVTVVTDLRNYTALDGGKLDSLSVTEGKVGPLAITSGKIDANAVIAGKLANGAIDTAARFASGVVDATALGTNAVTAPKVADQVIDDQHVFQRRKVSLNPNPNFMRSRS